MVDPLVHEHGCFDKNGALKKGVYATRREAKRSAKFHGLRFYRCGDCGNYHLTSRPKNKEN